MSKATNMYDYHSLFITKSRIKGHIHENGLECSENYFKAINLKIEALLIESIERAKLNARKRVLARDV